ncbi:LuxR C-terminal-related transcriptional regulator [Sporocytophaga myxococcoides]|uniref:LuxR C-terminal-related transcriptional regulator n=1 Tax=Sporocytophaga myxococcoides TaxID=153721 RepID=UPI00048D97DF|nr:LuxR C-terminal-related transcriptional regulator [Sporocytophaga myxococcoides]
MVKNIMELENFYKIWEKHALLHISPHTEIKSNFDLFNNEQFKKLMANSPFVTYIINHVTSKYEFFSDNCEMVMGYSSEEFKEKGVPLGMSITDPEYSDHVANFLIPKVFEFAEKYAKNHELYKLKFSYNYKIRKKDGTSIWIWQQMTILEADDNGNPLLTMVHLSDITHMKKDKKVDICISKKLEKEYEIIYVASYPEDFTEELLLSKRELEVLSLISKGESSKCIAAKLHISIYTVNNHRKNMLEKTGCRNALELINYGRSKCLAIVDL